MRILLVILLLLPACQKVRIESEFKALKSTTKNLTNTDIVFNSYSSCPAMEKNVNCILAQGLERDEAVRIAVMNNPLLQADFEMLGIAKADLAQAGLYTNPQASNLFLYPTQDRGPGTTQVNIENKLTGKISDLWRVPLRTRIYEDELEMVTLRILTTLLDVIERTKSAYDASVKADLLIKNGERILFINTELRDEIYYRQGFGFSNELDKVNADAQVAAARTAVVTYKIEQVDAYLRLTELLGVLSPLQHIVFTDTIMTSKELPDSTVIELYALDYSPEIQIARYKIKRYDDIIQFEKASVWKDVNTGVAYKQDFDKPLRGWGPAIDFEIPLFDNNYAQIAKAEFKLERAKKKMRFKTLKIQQEIRMFFSQAQLVSQEIKHYKEIIIPSYQKAINYVYDYVQTMQQNMLEALQTQLNFYRAEQDLIEKYYNFHVSYNKLERAYGKNIIQKNSIN
ncbi:TolC family protein [Candidatus Dependentiae bacterium]|nr:TolC family protein [Candidatus Dependentiae bacterium]